MGICLITLANTGLQGTPCQVRLYIQMRILPFTYFIEKGPQERGGVLASENTGKRETKDYGKEKQQRQGDPCPLQ